jgi:hypothetical protein
VLGTRCTAGLRRGSATPSAKQLSLRSLALHALSVAALAVESVGNLFLPLLGFDLHQNCDHMTKPGLLSGVENAIAAECLGDSA